MSEPARPADLTILCAYGGGILLIVLTAFGMGLQYLHDPGAGIWNLWSGGGAGAGALLLGFGMACARRRRLIQQAQPQRSHSHHG